MKQDPYAWAQSQQRKAANSKRQEELQKERDAAWGTPVHGITTPFVESFDSGGQSAAPIRRAGGDSNAAGASSPLPTSPDVLNYLVTKGELESALEQSYTLSKPIIAENRNTVDPVKEAKSIRDHEERHAKAKRVLERITTLHNGGAKDRKHANIRRCIDTFGRHVTDESVPRPAPPLAAGQEDAPNPVRGGPDTGSSEVQIAILTSKIRALALVLEGPKGHKDKHNKRNLRVLCHRRQKLLRYMERKERGSGRWQHMIDTLGLTSATWKGQISL